MSTTYGATQFSFGSSFQLSLNLIPKCIHLTISLIIKLLKAYALCSRVGEHWIGFLLYKVDQNTPFKTFSDRITTRKYHSAQNFTLNINYRDIKGLRMKILKIKNIEIILFVMTLELWKCRLFVKMFVWLIYHFKLIFFKWPSIILMLIRWYLKLQVISTLKSIFIIPQVKCRRSLLQKPLLIPSTT